ncbi:uncharacterized protein LOC120417492 [Culex pipiens pallens]|uniref:uncharacterized protein LOC120417492 n=1 Tax=Culex pipiens pallens TaxID=42434 RepID=UPI00195303F3|nr:uncharacterized protein LOC120417492 [Culex pipiens pallens]
MSLCGKCEQKICFEDAVPCSGKCRAFFHRSCTVLTKPAAKMIIEQPNAQFKCDQCLNSGVDAEISVLLADVKGIKEELQKYFDNSNSIPGINESIATRIDEAIKKGMENVMQACSEIFQKQIKTVVENSVANQIEKLIKSNSEKPNNKQIIKVTRKRGTHSESDGLPGSKRRAIIPEDGAAMVVDDEENENVFESPTFAEILKGGNSENKKDHQHKKLRTNRPKIVIKPNETNQSNDETRTFLKSNLDPKLHKINNLKNGRDGSIVAQCAPGENLLKVKNDIENKLGSNYTTIISSGLPKLKIVGMSEKYDPTDFVELLTSQNDEIFIEHVKVISSYENPRMKYNKFSVIIEVNNDTFDALITAGKVNIGFDRCSVFEAIKVLRCFKCGEFGHMSTTCKNNETCSKCSESHKTSDCNSTVMKCLNCLKKNNEQKMNLDVNHAAFSSKCPVFRHLAAIKKDRMYENE